jgi:hypothetical protein
MQFNKPLNNKATDFVNGIGSLIVRSSQKRLKYIRMQFKNSLNNKTMNFVK